jgi:hypothetical protein
MEKTLAALAMLAILAAFLFERSRQTRHAGSWAPIDGCAVNVPPRKRGVGFRTGPEGRAVADRNLTLNPALNPLPNPNVGFAHRPMKKTGIRLSKMIVTSSHSESGCHEDSMLVLRPVCQHHLLGFVVL